MEVSYAETDNVVVGPVKVLHVSPRYLSTTVYTIVQRVVQAGSMTKEATVALWVRVPHQPDKLDVAREWFATDGRRFILQEPDTLHWIAFVTAARDMVGAFDTFPDEDGRKAHLKAGLADSVRARAEELMREAPSATRCDILAMKVDKSKLHPVTDGELREGISIGTRISFTAKPDQLDAVRGLLKNAQSSVVDEPRTPLWYAVEFDGTNDFAVVAFFPDEDARRQHSLGLAAQRLQEMRDVLLDAEPVSVELDVIATEMGLTSNVDVPAARF